jgi:hypothetical protein
MLQLHLLEVHELPYETVQCSSLRHVFLALLAVDSTKCVQ